MMNKNGSIDDLEKLKDLVHLLKSNGIQCYRHSNLSLKFFDSSEVLVSSAPEPTEDTGPDDDEAMWLASGLRPAALRKT